MLKVLALVAASASCTAFVCHLPSSARAVHRKSLCVQSAEGADEEVLYAVGLSVARSLGELETLLSKDELRVVAGALTDKLLGEERKDFDWTTYGPEVEALLSGRQSNAQAAASSEGAAFLEAAGAEEGAVVTSSGLVYKEETTGTGAIPTADQKVVAHYTGRLVDGTVFDSSVERGEPLTFPLGAVIKGWQEGLQLMKVGGKALLTIPPGLGYGEQGTGPIPPGSTLQFEVELIDVLDA